MRGQYFKQRRGLGWQETNLAPPCQPSLQFASAEIRVIFSDHV
jgi:hypothetical protein